MQRYFWAAGAVCAFILPLAIYRLAGGDITLNLGPVFALIVAAISYNVGIRAGGTAALILITAYDLLIIAPFFVFNFHDPAYWSRLAPAMIAIAAGTLFAIPGRMARWLGRSAETVPQVVRCLGGYELVSRHLGVEPAEVERWVDRDRIPPGWHFRLHLMATAAGWRVSPTAFGTRCEGCPYRPNCFICKL